MPFDPNSSAALTVLPGSLSAQRLDPKRRDFSVEPTANNGSKQTRISLCSTGAA
jgi:hypothetical protein